MAAAAASSTLPFTESYAFNGTTPSLPQVCAALSNASQAVLDQLIKTYTPSPLVIEELYALCATQAPNTPPPSTVPTPPPIYDEGMSEDDAIALAVGVSFAIIVILILLGVVVAKRRQVLFTLS